MSHILITGGAGFIGTHTAELLVESGHRVRILDVLDPQVHGSEAQFPAYLPDEVECIRGDIRCLEDVERALEGIDAVYHFAALTGVGQSMYDIRDYFETNCTGTATLLEAVINRKEPLKKFVLASSRAVYGEGTHDCAHCGEIYPPTRSREQMESGQFELFCPSCGEIADAVPTAEDRPLSPISVYGWTKKHQEDLCKQIASTFGVPTVILRYFNVYGSRQSLQNPYTGVVSIFFSRLLGQKPISLYERSLPTRDFVHVKDIAQANVLALDAKVKPGTCLNIGTGESQTIEEIANALGQACEIKPKLIDRGEFRVGDICACYANISRSKELLGYEPQYQLQKGMQEFVSWAQGETAVDRYEQSVAELEKHGLFGRIGTIPMESVKMESKRRHRILFMAETVSLAHAGRPYVLAKSLDPNMYEVHFACDTPGDFVLKNATTFQRWPLYTIPSARFLENVAKGKPGHDFETLEKNVEDDLALLNKVKPDLVVGDFRLSLAVSAQVAGIPHAALTNAHWSAHSKRKKLPLPEMPANRILGVKLTQMFSYWTQGIWTRLLARPLNKLRRRYGLSPLKGLHDVLSSADYRWYTDLPGLSPTEQLPENHAYLGPILFEPEMDLPAWWNKLDESKPLLYITLGTSGQVDLLPQVIAAVAKLPVQAAVSTAGRLNLTDLPPNVFAADYLPGRTIAERSAMVISNGGNATSYQALAAGVPVLGIASNLDQFLTMEAIQEANAGILMRSSEASSARVQQAIEEILVDPAYRQATRKMASEIANMDAAARFQELLVQTLGHPSEIEIEKAA